MQIKQHSESANLLLVQTVWPFVLIIIVLLGAMILSLEVMSSVRAFVGGESLWSKGQKQANIALMTYLHTHGEIDYQQFLSAIAVPLGDKRARVALNQSVPDIDAAYHGFIEGGNSPDDVPGLIRLYLYFGHTPLMKKPIRIWAKGDIKIDKLLSLGKQLHDRIDAGEWKDTDNSRYLQQLISINNSVTPLEKSFSQSLAQASLQAKRLLEILLTGLTVALMTLGLLLSRRLALQRVLSSQALRKESEMNVAFLRNASDGIHILDTEGRIREASDSFCAMLGYSRNDIIGMSVAQWNAHFKKEEIPNILRRIITQKTNLQFETLHRRKDGSLLDVEITSMPLELDGQIFIYTASRDITARKRTEASLRESQERLHALYIGAPDGILMAGVENYQFEDANPKICAMLGYGREELLTLRVNELHPPSALSRVVDFYQRAAQQEVTLAQEIPVLRKDGTIFSADISIAHVGINGKNYFAGFFRDVTERRRAKEQIEYMAYHDQLTGLPNRSLFLDRLTQALTASKRRNCFGAIMFVDLDQFKRINDVHGHFIGDEVLKNVARRVRHFLRQGDTVARFGGDEFVILLPELSCDERNTVAMALAIGEKIRASLEQPARIDGQDYLASASIGIAVFPKCGENVEDLIREADIAMYRAKESGRNTLIFFEHEMQAHIAERYTLEQDLRNAARENRFELFLQSQLTENGYIVGAEALLRWNHPTRGIILPAAFIPLAEETNLIAVVGEWVLREACHLLARLKESGHNLRIAVNVSPRQFHQVNFVTYIRKILNETGANPRRLTLEITENLLVDRADEVVSRMLELSELGIRFSIDDFGTGYSSLAYLKRLPLNELKIDKSFVRDIPNDSNDAALVETILSVAHHLHLEVVAECVENRSQLDFLTTQGCGLFQGNFLHRPQPIREWLACLDNTA